MQPAAPPSAIAPPVARGWRVALAETLEAERERWFVFQPVLLGTGAAIYFALPAEPALLAAVLPLALACALWIGTRGMFAVMAGIAVTVSAGVALAKMRTEWVRAPVLGKRLSPSEVRGHLVLIEPNPKRGQRLTLHVTAIGDLPPDKLPSYVRVRAMQSLPGLQPGDAVELKATLAPPAAPALPGGYDFARTAWYQSLGGVGYSLQAARHDDTTKPAPLTLRISAVISRLRQAIGNRIVAALPGETGAIANALITGERGGISQATNDAFRNSGLFHILSISGLHMVIMAGAVFFLVRLCLAAAPSIALRYPIKKWAAVAAAIAALAYLLISGTAFATVRSYIMISIMFLAILLDRPAVAMRNVALAALVILMVYPESLLDVGFQMSFAAVVALVAAYEYINERRSHTRAAWARSIIGRGFLFFGGIVLSTIIAGVAVAPFAAYHFHTSQQFAVLANLIAIPLCNIIVMPAALLTLILMPFGLEKLPLAIMAVGIDVMVQCANWAARLPGAVGHVRAIPLPAFALMVIGGLWLTLWRTRWRTLGLLPVAAGLALAPLLPRPDMLIGRDGALVALRPHPDARFIALAKRNSDFELKRWLEADGDPRQARAAVPRAYEAGSAIRCDGIGCTGSLRERSVAIVRHPAALHDDCARADILILDIPRPSGCDHPSTVIDFWALRRLGTHAVYLEGDGSVRIETVAGHRGDRPWSALPPLTQPRVVAGRAGQAEPGNAAVPQREIRPEIEDDEEGEGEEPN